MLKTEPLVTPVATSLKVASIHPSIYCVTSQNWYTFPIHKIEDTLLLSSLLILFHSNYASDVIENKSTIYSANFLLALPICVLIWMITYYLTFILIKTSEQPMFVSVIFWKPKFIFYVGSPNITIGNYRKLFIFYPEPNWEQNFLISESTDMLIRSQHHWFLGVIRATIVCK